ncbi:MAG: tetratricopeptide repeat protein, partial [Candidatus Ranarchaeia archaeon]
MPNRNTWRIWAASSFVIGIVILLGVSFILFVVPASLPLSLRDAILSGAVLGVILTVFGWANLRQIPSYNSGSFPRNIKKRTNLENVDVDELLEDAKSFFTWGLEVDKEIKILEIKKKQTSPFKTSPLGKALSSSTSSTIPYEKKIEAFEQVIKRCDLVLSRDANRYEAVELKGGALYHLELYSEALPFQEAALKIEESSYGNFQAASSHFHLKQYKEAVLFLKKALVLNPSLVEGWILLYFLGKKLEDYKMALEALNEAIYLQPKEISLQRKRFKLLNTTLTDEDLFNMAHSQCWTCGS